MAILKLKKAWHTTPIPNDQNESKFATSKNVTTLITCQIFVKISCELTEISMFEIVNKHDKTCDATPPLIRLFGNAIHAHNSACE